MNGWTPIAAGVHLRRYGTDDLTVVVIEGPDGQVVVDSRGSTAQAEELLADVRALSSKPVVALINTHAHYDHTFGNRTLSRELGVSILGHGSIHQHFSQYAPASLPGGKPHGSEWQLMRISELPNISSERRIRLVCAVPSAIDPSSGCRFRPCRPGRRGHLLQPGAPRIAQTQSGPGHAAACHLAEPELEEGTVRHFCGRGTALVTATGFSTTDRSPVA